MGSFNCAIGFYGFEIDDPMDNAKNEPLAKMNQRRKTDLENITTALSGHIDRVI
jgi:hypothetical protein